MPNQSERAAWILTEAGVDMEASEEDAAPLSRLEICRRLCDLFQEAGGVQLAWDTPFTDLVIDQEVEVLLHLEERFGIPCTDEEFETLSTFGGLVLHVERRMRDLWSARQGHGGCPSQSLFYELRRTLPARPDNWYRMRRLRPATRLDECLPAAEAGDAGPLRSLLLRRYGVEDLPVELRVFGRMEFGATWLALWFLVLFVGGLCLMDGKHEGLLPVHFVGSALLVAFALQRMSRPVWTGVRTLGDLVRWTLRENEKAVARLDRALREPC